VACLRIKLIESVTGGQVCGGDGATGEDVSPGGGERPAPGPADPAGGWAARQPGEDTLTAGRPRVSPDSTHTEGQQVR